jgi:hypothetical protein
MSINTLWNIWNKKKVKIKFEKLKNKIFLYSSFNMPNFPCCERTEQISLKKHLMYKHNLSNTAGMKSILF